MMIRRTRSHNEQRQKSPFRQNSPFHLSGMAIMFLVVSAVPHASWGQDETHDQTAPMPVEDIAVHDEPEGMVSLFNGTDLTGWNGDPRFWTVVDGAIRGETTESEMARGNTFLIWTGGELDDFELRLSFRCTAANNSGIQYRSRHITEGEPSNEWVVRGYQHEIRNEDTFPNVSSFIYDEGGNRGRICLTGERAVWHSEGGKEVTGRLIDQEAFRNLMRVDDWNDVVITAEGNRIRHFLNGRLVLDFIDDDPKLALDSGVLALQLHAGAPMWVEYKDIRLQQAEASR